MLESASYGSQAIISRQQSAYLEALDDYIDYNEDGTLRKCLLDSKGNRLKDEEGNVKTLRHKFAVYCDDIAAGANTLEELADLFEALISGFAVHQNVHEQSEHYYHEHCLVSFIIRELDN